MIYPPPQMAGELKMAVPKGFAWLGGYSSSAPMSH
jgi:hypothetical protein